MAGKTLDLLDIISPDQLATRVAEQFVNWNNARQKRVNSWEEVRQYVYATDTTQTNNSSLPWKNKTTIPKLCQIRDNLFANYIAAMFPKRRWLSWEGDTHDDESLAKREGIETYMQWVVERSDFKNIVQKLIYDYLDYGICFATPDWQDDRHLGPDNRERLGYVGPVAVRINPLDLVMNPLAPSIAQAPKIIRSIVTLGELRDVIQSQTGPDDPKAASELFDYLMEIRTNATTFGGDFKVRDGYFEMDGFDSFKQYLGSSYVELLTFYGDMFDIETGEFLKNHIIVVADRHKLISKRLNSSLFGTAPIYSSSWRKRQDNLWGMGPLDNLVGMQYRIDHLENMKADVFDIIAYPPLKIKGYVEDFKWGPMERIYIGDEGDVEMLVPNVQALQANFEIKALEDKMEEMAGAPKQALGIRTPGEKTKFEVQTLENASSRVFQNKISQFEEEIVEPLLNSMLELARRKMDGTTSIRIFDDQEKIVRFNQLSSSDLTGQGRLRPMAARHFAEQAQLVQDMNNFFSSAVGQDPEIRRHISSIKLARMMEEVLDVKNYDLVSPNIRIIENAEAQTLATTANEQSMMDAGTPSGLTPDDSDSAFV